MAWTSPYIGELQRQGNFPFRVCGLFYCCNTYFRNSTPSVCRFFEVSLRLDSDAPRCDDLIDGVEMRIPFPNTVFKRVGTKISLAGERPRDTIAFSFDQQGEELLRSWGMIPEELFWPVRLTDELQRLIAQWREMVRCYTVDGMIDQLDWVCLQIIRELLLQRHSEKVSDLPEQRIKEAALYMLHHYDRELNCDEVASKFGFSHAAFFREWRRFFDLSPKSYVLEFRLKAAARLLLHTSAPVARIVKEVHFSGATAFHRKFRERFGVTPDTFRRTPESWMKKFPELELIDN